MDRRAWWAIVHGVAMSRTRLSSYTATALYVRHWAYAGNSKLSVLFFKELAIQVCSLLLFKINF